jgi:hypothetical protein
MVGSRSRETASIPRGLTEAILGTVSDAIIATDADGLISFWTPRAARIFGFTAEEAVERSPTGGKRFLLVLVSIAGVISYSALSGTRLNVDSISSLSQIGLDSVLAFFAAHGSYSLLTGKTIAPKVPNA